MQVGGAGSSGADLSSKLASTLGNALLQSDTFRGAFKRGMSSAAAGGLINAAVQQISADLGLDANTSGQLRSALVQAVTSVPQGSDSNSYAQAIAPAFARVLVSTNKLNARNAKQLGSNIATGLVKSVSVNAPRYGIRLPAINLDADLQKVNTVMVQFDASAPLSAGLGGVDASGSYPGGLDGSYPGGLDSTGGYAGGLDAGVDMQVGGAGSSGADLSSKLASTLGNALLQSDTFRGAFKRGMSSAAAGGLINAAVQQISADLGLDANTSGQLRSALVQAVTSVPQGSDSNSYAQAIAPAFARVLVSTNKLNARNAKQLGSNIATGLVKSVSVNAPRYGIRLPAINLDADLQKVNTVMVQFDASAPLSGLGGVVATGSGRLDSTDMFSSDAQDMSDANRISGSDDTTSSGVRSSLSLGSILNSPNGLKSPLANNRIKGLTSSLAKAVGPNGFNANVFARGLKGTLSQLSKSGMSPEQAKVEGLMEALVALVQILNSCQIGPVNTSNMSSTSNSMASALSFVLV
ncbi:hypothetical protein JTE90_006402 [Oedothorax gibbosus]|uniref:Aciniform spidroin 1 n=1 Tax=Oedothorax gibbosus TaxID=931172 RepID=A0AAV6VYK5_9ARAC|nr:hypothetical protein JTE90_006402 [Oedothorax gibbosus]